MDGFICPVIASRSLGASAVQGRKRVARQLVIVFLVFAAAVAISLYFGPGAVTADVPEWWMVAADA